MELRKESRSNSLRLSLCAFSLVVAAGCGGGGGGDSSQAGAQSAPSGATGPVATAGGASSGGSSGGIAARAAISAIDTGDILGAAEANVPFAQQSGYNGQVIGTYPAAQDIPETGINYSQLPNGETLRLGKVLDPLNPNSKVFAFQVAPSDPLTSSSKRSELEFPPYVQNGNTYWVAMSMYIPDWGTLPSGDDAVIGTQLHSGDSSKGYGPSFALASYGGAMGGRTFRVLRTSVDSSGSQINFWYPDIPIRFGQWVDFVFKFRHALDSSGLLQVWMDGQQIVDYAGPIGFNTPGFNDYIKFGYYNNTSFSGSRKILVRAPVIIQDPTGSKYSPDALRAYVDGQ